MSLTSCGQKIQPKNSTCETRVFLHGKLANLDRIEPTWSSAPNNRRSKFCAAGYSIWMRWLISENLLSCKMS